MKKEKMRFLSYRVLVLGLCAAGMLIALLLTLLLLSVTVERKLLIPFLVGSAMVFFLIWGAVVWIIKPFHRMENNFRLFLEGYTTSNVADGKEQITPSSELMAEKLQNIMNSAEMLNMNKRQAQYLALQNQINPHFLYNTLESIRSEALLSGLISVADMTEALASFFRYTISKVENLVSVEEELQNCETYFKIQQYRFGERLQLVIECDMEEKEEIYRCRIPKLTMQPILENSIIHGTECKMGIGHLKIVLEKIGERLMIRISDDGVGIDTKTLADMNEKLQKSAKAFSTQESETKGGIALVNVNNRIHLLFGEEYGIHVYSMPDVGTDVEIILPAINSDREIPNKEALG